MTTPPNSKTILLVFVLFIILNVGQIAAQQNLKIENNDETKEDGFYLINMIKNLIYGDVKKSPKTTLYGPFNAKDWWWNTNPTPGQILTHPKSATLSIEKKSIVTFTLNGHINTAGQGMQILFLKDGQPFVERGENHYFYGSYYQHQQSWQSLSFVQETLIQPGIYTFEVGLNCDNSYGAVVSVNGIGYTIKVQELE